MGWTAIVLAGSRPGTDHLPPNMGPISALIPVGGIPMVRRPGTRCCSPEIDRVRVLAQQPERITAARRRAPDYRGVRRTIAPP
jgi:hypothetical protein